jgi:hypothetical protein
MHYEFCKDNPFHHYYLHLREFLRPIRLTISKHKIPYTLSCIVIYDLTPLLKNKSWLFINKIISFIFITWVWFKWLLRRVCECYKFESTDFGSYLLKIHVFCFVLLCYRYEVSITISDDNKSVMLLLQKKIQVVCFLKKYKYYFGLKLKMSFFFKKLN